MNRVFFGALGCLAAVVAIGLILTAAPASADVLHLTAGLSEAIRFTATDLAGLAIGVGMTTLAADKTRSYELGEQNDCPVIAADIIYENAAVGDNGSGYARPLVAGDQFLGFALAQADNSAGAAGDVNVRVRVKGRVQLPVSGVAITSVGLGVYASDDDTFTLTATSNSYVGRIVRYVSSGQVVVEFDATRGALSDGGLGQITLTDQLGRNTGGTFGGTLTGTANDTTLGNFINAVGMRLNYLMQQVKK